MDDFNKEVLAAAEADALAERQEEEASILKLSNDPKVQKDMAEAIFSRLTQQFQEWPSKADQQDPLGLTELQHIGGDKKLAELIIKNIQLY